jgi:hypothetical protein
LVEGEAGRRGFAEHAGLVRRGKWDRFVQDAAPNLGDVPGFQKRVDLLAGGFGNIDRAEAGEAGGSEPAGGGLRPEGFAGVGVGELLPEFLDEVGWEDLLGTGVEENAGEEASEGFPERGVCGL